MSETYLTAYPFVAGPDTEPWCVWDIDMQKHNLAFLDSIEPTYFEHLAMMYEPHLETEEKQFAAIALRSAYAQGLETLFALTCATLQAPEMIIGWMLKYRPSKMEGLLEDINHGRPALFAIDVKPSWKAIADAMILVNTGDPEQDKKLKSGFAKLWARLAEEATDQRQISEYNNIKHGLRVGMGGWWVAMGAEETPGVPAPAANMHIVGKSEFGTQLYEADDLAKRNFRIKRRSAAWDPRKFITALPLISISINNVISFAKFLNGVEPSKLQLLFPKDLDAFGEPWTYRVRMNHFEMNTVITAEMIEPLSKEEIIDAYPKTDLTDFAEEIGEG